MAIAISFITSIGYVVATAVATAGVRRQRTSYHERVLSFKMCVRGGIFWHGRAVSPLAAVLSNCVEYSWLAKDGKPFHTV